MPQYNIPIYFKRVDERHVSQPIDNAIKHSNPERPLTINMNIGRIA